MKSLREIAFSIINAVNGFVTSDDQRIEQEWVYDKIWDVYATLKRKYRKENGHLEPADYAMKCCLEVKCRHEKCEKTIETKTGTQVITVESPDVQYYVELPDIDWYGTEDPIAFFGSDGLKIPYHYVSPSGWQNSDSETYIGGVPTYTVIGSEALLKNLPTSSQTLACIVAVLENPGDKCRPDDSFPAPRGFIYELELLVKKDILSAWGINPDLLNNANDLRYQPAVQRQQSKQEQEDTE